MSIFRTIKERRHRKAQERQEAAEAALRLNPPQPDDRVKTGRMIDMRQGARYFGHDYVMTSDDTQPGLLRGHLWVTPGAKVGDDLRWTAKGADGQGYDRIGRIVWVRWMRNPDDMYEVFVRVVGRQEEGTA